MLLFAVLLFLSLAVNTYGQEADAAIRYIAVERISFDTIYIPGPGGDDIPVNTTHFAFTFALFHVEAQSDRCYYKVWITRDEVPMLVAAWAIGFSAPEDRPPGLQGIYPDYFTDLVAIHTIMAEFPYTSEVRTHPVDGTQTYYFYRIHFYFNNTLWKGEQVRLASDYMQEPTYTGSELLILQIKNEKTKQGETIVKFKEVKQ